MIDAPRPPKDISGLRRGTKGQGRWDWKRLERMYVEGVPDPEGDEGERLWLTMAQLSERAGITLSYVYACAAKRKWTAKRDAFRDAYEARLREERAARLAKASARIDASAIRATGTGFKVIERRMSEIEEEQLAAAARKAAYEVLVAGGMPRAEAEERSGWEPYNLPVDARELHALAQSGVALHTLKSRAAGEVESRRTMDVAGSLEVRATIVGELSRDDAGRLEDFVQALERARMGQGLVEASDSLELPGGDIVDAELVDEEGS